MHIVFFILSPIVSFLRSCCDLQKRSAQIVFVLFFGLFGYCHTFEDVRADSYRKYEHFMIYQSRDFSDIYRDLSSGEIKDVYEEILFSCVKNFTDNPHIMMMIVGLIGGFFYMLVVKRFLRDKKVHFTWPIIILTIFIVIESNISIMGNIRSFSAFPLIMYSIIKIFYDNKRIWILGLLATPFIHYGFLPIVIASLFLFFIKLPSRLLHYVCIGACITSIFISTSSYNEIMDTGLEYIDNESISNRVESYGSVEAEEHFAQSLTTKLISFNNKISACFVVLFLLFVRKNIRLLVKNNYDKRLYNVWLFFTAIGFAFISFSVVGQRYVYIAMVLMYMFMLNIYQNNSVLVKKYIYALPIVYILHIAWAFYNCYCNTGLNIYYQPLPFLLL